LKADGPNVRTPSGILWTSQRGKYHCNETGRKSDVSASPFNERCCASCAPVRATIKRIPAVLGGSAGGDRGPSPRRRNPSG
jgi:hypothetical protein